MPQWLYEELTEMAMLRGWNFTEMLMMAAEKGLNWYQKDWKARHPDKKEDKKAPEEGAKEERCPNDQPHQKNKPLTPEESKKLDKEIDDLMNEIYGKDEKKKK